MPEDNYCVYVHRAPNGKKYIGITRKKPEYRWRNGSGYSGNIYFKRAIDLYGWENFNHYILARNLSKEEAEIIEIELIKEHRTNNRDFGYNIENGGNCFGTHSEETKRKIGEKSKGNKYCAGRVMSEWHKQQLINSNIGHHHNLGRKASDETRNKISQALTGRIFSEEHMIHLLQSRKDISGVNNPMYGKKHSEETRKKISYAVSATAESENNKIRLKNLHQNNKKKVVQLLKDMTEIAVFDSMDHAAISISGNSQNIGFACRNTDRTYKGFYWRYYNDDNS